MTNPIPEIISDTDFDKLHSEGFIDAKGLRNHLLKKKYDECKYEGMRSGSAIKQLTSSVNLKADSVRKILYFKTNKYESL